MYILGLQIGLNFVPVFDFRTHGRSTSGHEIEFFCGLKCT
jgi:hypothetical protein